MRVAITTDDLEHVDVGFGIARQVAVYDVRRGQSRLLRVFSFGAPAGRCDPKSLGNRGAAIKNCLLLFTLEIGDAGSAIARGRGVEVVRVVRRRPIAEVLATLQRDLVRMRPWFRAEVLGVRRSR